MRENAGLPDNASLAGTENRRKKNGNVAQKQVAISILRLVFFSLFGCSGLYTAAHSV